ncbi:MAG TPA: N-acetylglucosamine-6-phosphate deacetylase [Thermoanaerobaculia bacterium]|nr:N-acetylglucosamine-6-phosphate deacetylase [Thermoanaerobaculia bacterium]
MSEPILLRGRAWTGGAIHEDVVVEIDDGRFTDVRLTARIDDPKPNLDEGLMIPGLIDLHVHGASGSDFMDGTEEAARNIARFHLHEGTTALAATTLSGSSEAIERAVRSINAVAARYELGEAAIAGVNLEGPYLNPAKAGAQDPGSLRPADPREVTRWLGLAPELSWIMTVAPEIEGVLNLIRELREQICFAIGHTAADYGQTVVALEAGASHFTHLYNAMPPLHHRDPGPVGAALVDAHATVELIADGIHLHPAILHSIATLLPGRACLVTDAMRACGMPDGAYRLHQHEVEVKDGSARLSSGALAGSTLTMRRALQNMVELAGVPLETVIPLATAVPARVLGLEGIKGRITIGHDADLIVLSQKFEITQVISRGVRVA